MVKEALHSEVFKGYILPLVLGLAGYFAAYMTLIGTEKQIGHERVKLMFEQLETQRQRIESQDETISELRAEITRLTIQLAKTYDSGRALKGYLRSMPTAAWIKKTNIPAGSRFDPKDADIRMWYINPRYEILFGVTNAKYQNKTDFEVGIWPLAVAESFRGNDLATLYSMGGECVDEQFPTAQSIGELVDAEVCKWITEIEGFYAIAGSIKLIRR